MTSQRLADPAFGVSARKLNLPSHLQIIPYIKCGLMFSDGPTKAYLDSLTLA